MSYRKTTTAAAVLAASSTVIGTVTFGGAAYGVVKGFEAQNWASSAMAGAGTDAALRVKLTDADGVVFYLDASDRDYKTAKVHIAFSADDTATGLGYVPTDATGAAATAGGAVEYVAKSPISVQVDNAGTATDYFVVTLKVET